MIEKHGVSGAGGGTILGRMQEVGQGPESKGVVSRNGLERGTKTGKSLVGSRSEEGRMLAP